MVIPWIVSYNFLIQFSYNFERSDHNYHYDRAVTKRKKRWEKLKKVVSDAGYNEVFVV